MLNAGLLYKDVTENEQTTGRPNQGMFVGCHIDVSTGILTFTGRLFKFIKFLALNKFFNFINSNKTANDKPTKYRFRCEPGKLFNSHFLSIYRTLFLN